MSPLIIWIWRPLNGCKTIWQNAGKAVILLHRPLYFLDAVATKIIEIERTKLFYYEGNYSAYIRGKLIRATDNKRKESTGVRHN